MSTRTMFLIGYLVMVIAIVTCQQAARHPAARVAKFADVVRAIKRSRAGWVVLILAWWWLGFHVLARSSGA